MPDYKQLGNDAYQNKHYPLAVDYYTAGIQEDPQNAALFSNRSAAYLKMEDFGEAKRDADICIHLDPTWSKGWWRKGTAQFEAQDYKGAQKTFADGLIQCPDDSNLVAAVEKAHNYLKTIQSIQGPGESPHAFDPDGPSQRQPPPDPAAAPSPPPPTQLHHSEKWPANAQQEIDRIKQAPNHYAILHVVTDTSNAEMKKNYYTLAKLLHPDKCQLHGAEDAMTSVSQAYDTLTNVIKKTLYDQYLSQIGEDAQHPNQTYQEWESRQQPVEMPKWLSVLLGIKGCGWILALLIIIVCLPILFIVLIVYILCLPIGCIMSQCFPEKYERMKEQHEKEKAKMEEQAQDRAFAHV